MNNKCLTAYALLAASTAFGAQAQTVVINLVPNATFNGSPNENTDQPSGTSFTSAGGAGSAIISTGIDVVEDGGLANGRGTFTPFTLSGIDEDGVAVSGTFTVAVTVTDGDDAVIGRGGVGAIGSATSLTFSDVVLTNVSGDDVFQFDGFSGVYLGSTDGTNDLATVNGGEAFAPVAAGNSINSGNPAELVAFAPVSSLEIGFAGGSLAVNGVAANFSVVPEPASMALIGLGSLAMIGRRRKA